MIYQYAIISTGAACNSYCCYAQHYSPPDLPPPQPCLPDSAPLLRGLHKGRSAVLICRHFPGKFCVPVAQDDIYVKQVVRNPLGTEVLVPRLDNPVQMIRKDRGEEHDLKPRVAHTVEVGVLGFELLPTVSQHRREATVGGCMLLMARLSK